MFMKSRIFALVVAFCALSLSLNAQLMWKITGNGLTKPSYLFGTHHLIDKEQIKGFDKVMAIAKEAETVVGEMNMTDMAAVQQKLMKASLLSGKTCKELYSADDYAFLDKEFKALLGTGLDQLGVMKPMALSTVYLLYSYLKMTASTKQPQAVDIMFQNLAKENGKKVVGLETPEYQADVLFNSSTIERQAEILLKQVREKDKYAEMINKLNEAYLQGDFIKAEQLDKDDDSMNPEERLVLITNRNNNWMKQLPDLINQQACFVAVGFLHLVGDLGLVNQLKKAGYTLEPVVLQ
jgi:uncharacterized protein YbaP (TraB family)